MYEQNNHKSLSVSVKKYRGVCSLVPVNPVEQKVLLYVVLCVVGYLEQRSLMDVDVPHREQ